jgi:high-affinity iron transporter
MGATFVITLREAFEAALLLGIVYTFLDKVGRRDQSHYVTLGALLGVLASVALGGAVSLLSGPLVDLGPDVLGVGVLVIAVVALTWHGWWMRQHARAMKDDIQRRLEAASSTHRLWIVGLIAFTGVFREGAETVLFFWGLLSQASVSGLGGAAGATLGIATAALLGWAIFRGGQRVSLSRFFLVTSVLLLFVAGGLLSSAVGKLQGLGFLPATAVAWNTSSFLDDGGTVGGFLAGLLGYRAKPSLLEAGAYVLYLAGAGVLLFGDTIRRTPRQGAAPPPGVVAPRDDGGVVATR